jgi:hypothetical protein
VIGAIIPQNPAILGDMGHFDDILSQLN